MTEDRQPDWLEPIRIRVERSPSSASGPRETAWLKPAAVLVLLIDSESGPLLVLTQRAGNLRDYPGILAFPGGSGEPSDHGPVANALREAAEEIGLVRGGVHVVGLLEPLALPSTGFLVTPVIGWCTKLQCDPTMNSDEVAATVQVPFRDFADGSGRVQRLGDSNAGHSAFRVDGIAVGKMTTSIIDALIDSR